MTLDPAVTLMELHVFPPPEGHRANDLGDLLEAGGLDPVVDYGEDGAGYVFVLYPQLAQAEEIARRFLSNADGALAVPAERRPPPSRLDRAAVYSYVVGLPLVVLVGSVIAVVRSDDDVAWAGGLIAGTLALVWLVAFVVLRRRTT